MSSKQVLIERDLFAQLVKYFNDDHNLNSLDAHLIRERLNGKLDKVVSHILYERYKRASTSEERSIALQEYLDNINPQAYKQARQRACALSDSIAPFTFDSVCQK